MTRRFFLSLSGALCAIPATARAGWMGRRIPAPDRSERIVGVSDPRVGYNGEHFVDPAGRDEDETAIVELSKGEGGLITVKKIHVYPSRGWFEARRR